MDCKDILFETIVNILDRKYNSIGTGFFISSKCIITCLHNLTQSYQGENLVLFRFLEREDIYSANWRTIDNKNLDIAILEVRDSNEKFLETESAMGYLNALHTFGFPEGSKTPIHARPQIYGYTKSEGEIYIQLGNANDITVGFSGAPLLNEHNNVIGVISHITNVSEKNRMINTAFAIPIDTIRKEIPDLLSSSEIKAIEVVGRKSEINLYRSELSKRNLLCISGMAGVGKTTIGKYIYNEISGYEKIWYTFTNEVNDEFGPIIFELAKLIARLGNLQPLRIFYDIHRGYIDDYDSRIDLLAKMLIDEIAKREVLICFDDVHIVFERPKVFNYLKELSRNIKNNKIILISRKKVDFCNHIEISSLEGLSYEDCLEFVKKAGVELTGSQFDILYKKTQGNVKITELLLVILKNERNIDEILKNTYSEKSIHSYITNNIYENLEPLEKKITKILAISRTPLSLKILENVLGISFTDFFYALNNLIINHIVENENGNYSMHALLKEYFSALSAHDNIIYHRKLALNLSKNNVLEISYHFSCCGMIKESLDILNSGMNLIINDGRLSVLKKQITNYFDLIFTGYDCCMLNIIFCKMEEYLGNYEIVINKLQDTLKQIQGTATYDTKKLKYEMYVLLFQCFEKRGEYEQALQCLEQAELYVSDDKVDFAILSIYKGFLLCHMEKIKKGIKICKSGLEILKEEKADNRLMAEAFSHMGWNYTIKGKYDEAANYLTEACKYFKGDGRGICLAKIRLARIFWQQGRLNRALEDINIAVDIANDIEDLQLKAFAIRQKNLIVWNKGNLVEALEGHIESERIYRKINDKWGLAATLENKAAVLFDLGRLSEAEICIDEAIQICKENNITDFLAYAYTYKSKILSYSNRVSEAISYARKAIFLLLKWRYSIYYLGMSLISLGIAYLNKKSYLRAFIIFSIAAERLKVGKNKFQENLARFYLIIIGNIKGRNCDKNILKIKKINIYQYFKEEAAFETIDLLEKLEELYLSNSFIHFEEL